MAGISSTSTFLPGYVKNDGGQYLFYFAAVFWPSRFVRNAPRVLFVNHPATDTLLCLCLFTLSGNVAPRLFWRGLAASYLTDLPMKSQTQSLGFVGHITGPDNNLSLSAAPEKSCCFLGLKDMENTQKLQCLNFWSTPTFKLTYISKTFKY